MGRSGYETTGTWEDNETETPYSTCSAETPGIEKEHPLFSLKESFLEVVMAAYMQAKARKTEKKGPQGIGQVRTSVDSADHEHAANIPERKRRFSDDTLEMPKGRQIRASLTKRRAQDRRLWFACPYAKMDPVKYRHCYGYCLSRIRDVKQHLSRCHRKPIYCAICGQTFEDEDARDSHTAAMSCARQPFVIQGISDKQRRELSQRVSSKMPEEQQWFTVFDILFFPRPRPKTPYRDRELSEDLCVFQDFITARGPVVLAGFLEGKGMTTSNLPHEERDLRVFMEDILREGLHHILDEWASDNARAEGQDSIPHSPQASYTIDSGISIRTDPQITLDESGQLGEGSGRDFLDPSRVHERPDEDRNRSLPYNFASQVPGESTRQFQTECFPRLATGEGTPALSEKASINPDRSQREFPSFQSMPRFETFSDNIGPSMVSPANEFPDMLDFDIEWPT
ncbi:hypothetical protein GGS23DRAFT_513496 [Durotheca rogersii]|uniref:uncharacterized protein n=1 Tax=Durotheca rogersii TaxID=419775 RepID=UPI0022209C6A|nr:uncharacterized protein GGS23DRAFT_513496 [Durotheca rogersii]KAI5863776.1 hypothetical protein GGS23DRAFT_513496 [Durotheca rogersii]